MRLAMVDVGSQQAYVPYMPLFLRFNLTPRLCLKKKYRENRSI